MSGNDGIKRVAELETALRHLENELRLTRAEYEESNRKYLDIHYNLEILVQERTAELELANRRLQAEVEERCRAEADKTRLEGQLRQSQKMEAIGTLAGGIAHDFNNLLVAILGFAEMAREGAEPGGQVRADLDEVLGAGKRARDLVRQILTFSRQSDLEKKPLLPGLLIKEALKLLRGSLPSSIEVRQNILTQAAVNGDPTQIHQVLINLCTNAAHAMQAGGGTLEVSLVEANLTAAELGNEPDVEPGRFVRLSVRDTGTGIEPVLLNRIFEPYFTTKGRGEGTGMGLAVVHGIVRSHQGAIRVESEPGQGTVFHVYLPAISSEVEVDADVLQILPTGHERILFVDDEWAGAEVGRKQLESLGYAVTLRTSSVEALEALRADPQRFDLVVTDHQMPNMSGFEMAREMLILRPDLPVILCTGYSATVTRERALKAGLREFALKPLTRKELAELVRAVLDG